MPLPLGFVPGTPLLEFSFEEVVGVEAKGVSRGDFLVFESGVVLEVGGRDGGIGGLGGFEVGGEVSRVSVGEIHGGNLLLNTRWMGKLIRVYSQ